MKAGWKTDRLGDVCAMIARGVAPKYIESGGKLVLNQKCVRDHVVNFDHGRRHDDSARAVSADRLLIPGDVLVNSTGTGTLGRVAQIRDRPPVPMTVDTHVTIVRPNPGKFFLDFFGYMLIQIEDEIAASGEGASGQTELSRTTLSEKFHVSYPDSLEEQRRIVAVLDEAFAGIASATANAQKNLANARALFEGHLQSIFSKRGEGWKECRLGDVAARITDGTHLSPKYVAHGVAMLDSKHIGDAFEIEDQTATKFISAETDRELAKRCKPASGDILISSRGSIGKIAIVRPDQDFNIMGNMILVRLPAHILPEYGAYFFYSEVSKMQAMAKGVAQKGLYLNQIREYVLPVPLIEEQREIVAALGDLLDARSSITEIYERKLTALAELKQSLLQKAFAGELTR